MDSERTRVTLIPTGDPRVDQAIAGLSDLDEIDLDDRPAVLEEVHDRLREILGELGDAGRLGPADAARPGSPGFARPGEPGRRGEQAELGASGTPGPGVQGAAPRPGSPGPGGGGWRRPGA
jgi:hypothetical protein